MLSGIAAHYDPSFCRDWGTKCRVSPEIHMPARTAKFVSAIFASILAGIPLATVSHGATPAADDCLSGPKDPAPNGSHWYYRIDHATKRHCWYLKDEKPSQSAAANSSPSAKPASPSAETTTQRSIADAHAELPAQAAIEQPKRGDGLAPAIAADATIATPAAETQRSAVASRWPEQSGTSSSTVPPSTAANSDCRRTTRSGRDTISRTCRGCLRRSGLMRLKNSRARFRRCCSSFSAHWRWRV